MNKRIFIWGVVFIIFISISSKNLCGADDKLEHFGFSSLFGAAGETYLHYKTDLNASRRIILGATLGTLPGFIKEIIDSTEKGNHFSGTDLAADVAGAFFGAIVANLFNNMIHVKVKTAENSLSCKEAWTRSRIFVQLVRKRALFSISYSNSFRST